jgi:hypothetical protein
VRLWRAPESHHAVADEFIDRATQGRNGIAGNGEEAMQHDAQEMRSCGMPEGFRQRREAQHVDEQDLQRHGLQVDASERTCRQQHAHNVDGHKPRKR